MRRALLVLAPSLVVLATVGAALFFVAERRVIGGWEYSTLDAIGRMRFCPDHKTAWSFVEGSAESIEPQEAVYGTWQIRGMYPVCDMDYTAVFKDSDMKPPPSHGKLPLADFLVPRPKTGDRPYMVRIHD
jgi:hypothetical protein